MKKKYFAGIIETASGKNYCLLFLKSDTYTVSLTIDALVNIHQAQIGLESKKLVTYEPGDIPKTRFTRNIVFEKMSSEDILHFETALQECSTNLAKQRLCCHIPAPSIG